jgi:hypothetical protein
MLTNGVHGNLEVLLYTLFNRDMMNTLTNIDWWLFHIPLFLNVNKPTTRCCTVPWPRCPLCQCCPLWIWLSTFCSPLPQWILPNFTSSSIDSPKLHPFSMDSPKLHHLYFHHETPMVPCFVHGLSHISLPPPWRIHLSISYASCPLTPIFTWLWST